MGSEVGPRLPVIDFTQENLTPGTGSWLEVCCDIRQALEDFGCFMITYDKIPQELVDQVFSVSKELFDLPTETKIQNRCEVPLTGYVGQIAKLPLHESMGIDNVTSLEEAQAFTNLMWPDGNNRFCKYVFEYAKLAAELDQTVARMIFESYGVEKHYDSYAESTSYLLRLLKNRVPRKDETTLGFVTHTDKSFTTILHQNQVDGLEVETKDGKKINVEYLPSSFVVVAGDALMAWSNDRIISPAHRVIMNGKIDRYSVGLFAFHRGTLQVPEELVDEEHPLMYKPFSNIGLLRFYRTDEGYSSKCPVKAYCGV